MLESPLVEMVHISEEDFYEGWRMFLKYQDKGFSFTDCLSFMVMEKMDIRDVLAFDEHFEQRGLYGTSGTPE